MLFSASVRAEPRPTLEKAKGPSAEEQEKKRWQDEYERTGVAPIRRTPNSISFAVKKGPIDRISVRVITTTKDGRKDTQIFEMYAHEDAGAYNQDARIWTSKRIYAALRQWSNDSIESIDFDWTTHYRDGKKVSTRESGFLWKFASRADAAAVKKAEVGSELTDQQRIGDREARGSRRPNQGKFENDKVVSTRKKKASERRGYDKYVKDDRVVQEAATRLAKNGLGSATYVPLPGGDTRDPLHVQRQIVSRLRYVTEMKKKHKDRDYFADVMLYNFDDAGMMAALKEAHKAGIKVEVFTDWTKSTPFLPAKPAIQELMNEGVTINQIVRNEPIADDYRTNHAKLVQIGRRKRGRIVEARTFHSEANAEFHKYPDNQEGMLVSSDRDFATVVQGLFRSLKGGTTPEVTIDPKTAKFMLLHSTYALKTPDGRAYRLGDGMRDFYAQLAAVSDREETDLRLLAAHFNVTDKEVIGALGRIAKKWPALLSLNGYKLGTDGREHRFVSEMARFAREGHMVTVRSHDLLGAPMHHKITAMSTPTYRAAIQSSGNPDGYGLDLISFPHDDHGVVMRASGDDLNSRKARVFDQIEAQASRVAFDRSLGTHDHAAGSEVDPLITKVKFSVMLPERIQLPNGEVVSSKDVESVKVVGDWQWGVGQAPKARKKLPQKGRLFYYPDGANHRPTVALERGEDQSYGGLLMPAKVEGRNAKRTAKKVGQRWRAEVELPSGFRHTAHVELKIKGREQPVALQGYQDGRDRQGRRIAHQKNGWTAFLPAGASQRIPLRVRAAR
jgi:hypothetical protein